MAIFDECYAAHSRDVELTLRCVSDWIESENMRLQEMQQPANESQITADELTTWMLLLAGALVFVMQAGFAMLCAGSVRKQNIANTLLKNLLDACGAAIAFYATGYAFAYGTRSGEVSFIGDDNFFLQGDVDPAVFFFQYGFSAAAVTIVAGTLAERCQMVSYIAYSLFFVGLVYPVVAHNIWGLGYFSMANGDPLVGSGVVDCAGSAVVHLTGGFTALYATVVLGPRQGRFFDLDGNPKKTPGLTKGHSVGLQTLGAMLLWFGWYGFNPGSALLLNVDQKGSIAAYAAVTTTLGGAAGGLSALMINALIKRWQTGEFTVDLVTTINGLLTGLAAVTGGCMVIPIWASLVIGLVSGGIYLAGSNLLIRLKIDDAIDAIPVHLGGGLWGVVAAGLFASPELLLKTYGTDSHPGFFYAPTESNLLGAQLTAIGFVMSWTFCTLFPFFILLSSLGMFRVNALDELIGLDATYEGSETPSRLFDDDSKQNEEKRLDAFKQRFEERKQMRSRKKKKKTLDDVMNASWGHAEFNSVDGSREEGISTDDSGDGISLNDSRDGMPTDFISESQDYVDEAEYILSNNAEHNLRKQTLEQAPKQVPYFKAVTEL